MRNGHIWAGQYLGFKHNFGQLPPLFGGKACLFELLEAVGEPLPLLQAAQLAGLHRHVATVGAFKVGLNLLHRSLSFPQVPQTLTMHSGGSSVEQMLWGNVSRLNQNNL